MLRVEYAAQAVPDNDDTQEMLKRALITAERVLNEGARPPEAIFVNRMTSASQKRCRTLGKT